MTRSHNQKHKGDEIMNMPEHSPRTGWFQSKWLTWVLLGILAIGAFFLITGQTALFLGALPFLLLLICPLMMFFMMRGMHGGADDHDHEQPPEGGRQ
jgi:hypothetical protein